MLNRAQVLKIGFVFSALLVVGLVFPKQTQAQIDPCSTVGPNSISKDISRNPVELDSDVDVWIPFPRDTLAGFGPADIMLVMDVSGSMNNRFSGTTGPTKLEVAKQALKTFVNSSNLCLNRIGLALFSTWGNSRIVMNLSNDAAALNAAIDALTAGGTTSIGGGLHRGLEGLLSTAPGRRAGVDGHVVLATDGGQNTWPSNYDCWDTTNTSKPCSIPGGSIIQQAINMRVKVWSVGIGASLLTNAEFTAGGTETFDPTGLFPNQNACPYGGATRTWVQPTGPSTCPNGILDSEDYMIDVARRTGGNYYYVADASRMDTVYRQILADITRSLGFTVADVINPRIFTGVDLTRMRLHRVVNSCSEANAGNDITSTVPAPTRIGLIFITISGYRNWSFVWNIGFVPRTEGRCIVIPTHVKPDAPLNSQEIDSPNLTDAECPKDEPYRTLYPGICNTPPPPNNPLNPGFWQFVTPRVALDEACITNPVCRAQSLPRMPIANRPVTIIDPARPWVKALGASVGSLRNIDPIRRDLFDPAVTPGSSAFNSEFLTILNGSILSGDWVSAKDWLVKNYTSFGGLTIRPAPVGNDIYQGFLNAYSSKGIVSTGPSLGSISAQATAGNRIQTISGAGNLTITQGTYNGPPAVVFVPGDLIINSGTFNTHGLIAGTDPISGIQTGLIFVVRGNITIDRNVNRVDAYMITNGVFNSNSDPVPDCDPQLTVNGGVVAYGEINLDRNLRCSASNPNRDLPAEIFSFPHRYLWLFREVIGDSKSVFREVAP